MLFRVFSGFVLSSPAHPFLPSSLSDRLSSFFSPLEPDFSLSFAHTAVSPKTFRDCRERRERGSRESEMIRHRGSSSLSLSLAIDETFESHSSRGRRRNSSGNNKSDYLDRLFLSSARLPDVRAYDAACHCDETLRHTHSSESSRRLCAAVRNVKARAMHPTSENMKRGFISRRRALLKRKQGTFRSPNSSALFRYSSFEYNPKGKNHFSFVEKKRIRLAFLRIIHFYFAHVFVIASVFAQTYVFPVK